MTLDFEIAENNASYIDKKEEENVEEKTTDEANYKIKKMISRGVVFLTYIVAENEDGMYLIDQHAAAERINYEKIMKKLKEKPMIIDLLVPLKIELSKDEFLIAKDGINVLTDYGFDIDDFGFNSFIVRKYTNWIDSKKALDCIKKIFDIICDKKEFNFDKFVWRMAATTACRMSVMANEYISLDEQQWILDNIRKCENPFTCPHGRPTIITYTKYDLEKLFKRSLD